MSQSIVFSWNKLAHEFLCSIVWLFQSDWIKKTIELLWLCYCFATDFTLFIGGHLVWWFVFQSVALFEYIHWSKYEYFIAFIALERRDCLPLCCKNNHEWRMSKENLHNLFVTTLLSSFTTINVDYCMNQNCLKVLSINEEENSPILLDKIPFLHFSKLFLCEYSMRR